MPRSAPVCLAFVVAVVPLALSACATRAADVAPQVMAAAPAPTVPPETATTFLATTTSEAPTTTAPPTTTTTAPPPTTTELPGPPPGAPAARISRGGNGRPIVALSFDAGSDVGHAAFILDVLKAEGVHASFGVTGRWAEKNPDLFRRIVAEGHHLINHTYSHESATGRSTGSLPLSRSARVEQVRRAEEAFQRVAGVTAKPWFRPPYGDIDPELDKMLGDEGYRYDTLWSVDSLGWKGLEAGQITSRCAGGLRPGAILLFHVGVQSQDADALPGVLAAIRAAGLQAGSVLDVM